MNQRNEAVQPDEIQEPIMIRYVSKVTGNVYDELTVDHVTDMALIYYSSAGSIFGSVTGACIGGVLVGHHPTPSLVLTIVPVCGFLGALSGALLVMLGLNMRGLLQWDKYQIRRTYKLKNGSKNGA
jgi:hypothetical protein